MLIEARTLSGFQLHSRDGEIGRVKEFFFDDRYWVIRYLVADTGTWLMGRQVIISPYALGAVSKDEQHIVIDLTKQQIEDSPPLSSDLPVSRQFEDAYYGYFAWPTYWNGDDMWGSSPYIERDQEKQAEAPRGQKIWDPNLRSTRDVTGYRIQAVDGEVGHVEDFIIDDLSWAIRYLVIDTRNWWPRGEVLLSPRWIMHVSWSESTVFVDLPRETISGSPRYTKESLLTRDYEIELYRHYDREGYWTAEPAPNEHSR